jgi:hypothetical protein
MASNINPNNINGNYPVAGQDNDSQGFRDNFTNISNNFSFAATEITALQNAVTNVQSTVGTDGNVLAFYGNVENDLIVNGHTTMVGDAYVNGNIVLTDGSPGGPNSIYPATSSLYNLGTANNTFANVYAGNIIANVSSATNSVHYYRIEQTNIVASAATATQNISVLNGARWFFTANANANSTLNFVGSSSMTFANALAVGQSMRVEVAMTQGATPYYPTAHQIDSVAQTVKWLNGTAPTTGNANSVNLYNYTITKTASPNTYTVLASQSRYA